MHVLVAFLISAALISGFYPIQDTPPDEIRFMAPAYDGIVTNTDYHTPHVLIPVEHRLDLKPSTTFEHARLVRQQYDFSCGSAALATILKYLLSEDFTETQVIHGLLKFGDKQKIMERRAFSLLDMKKFVTALGYTGVGYKAQIKDLKNLDMPCILPMELYGYRHFTVFKGIYKDHIFLADPFRGNTSYPVSDFEKMWHQNVLFVVYPAGAKQLSLLEIKSDDLRFIDEDRMLDILLHDPTIISPGDGLPPPEFDPERRQYYKK